MTSPPPAAAPPLKGRLFRGLRPGKDLVKMEVYSIVNLKGGVGKTVTACNLAAILGAYHGLRVLLIDADAQANATAFFGCNEAGSTLG